ncbi:uncharacterized protein LOC120176562 [Hibiscus syriacus]|uniref:uncharacterized protein LOC120176562 n=1 Tax=Hibiscus syriacus TaxID=106335 RepID=UPI00192060B4|nr:uncharacterized protein LOC120176562 [Hibiscus syriacus]
MRRLQCPTHTTNRVFCISKTITKLSVIPKIRVFAWRLAHNGLPVGKRLWEAGFSTGACPMCCIVEETIVHEFKECWYAKQTFEVAGFSGISCALDGDSGMCWLEDLARKLPTKRFAEFVILLWNIWNGRNAQVLQKEFISARNQTARGAVRTDAGPR